MSTVRYAALTPNRFKHSWKIALGEAWQCVSQSAAPLPTPPSHEIHQRPALSHREAFGLRCRSQGRPFGRTSKDLVASRVHGAAGAIFMQLKENDSAGLRTFEWRD